MLSRRFFADLRLTKMSKKSAYVVLFCMSWTFKIRLNQNRIPFEAWNILFFIFLLLIHGLDTLDSPLFLYCLICKRFYVLFSPLTFFKIFNFFAPFCYILSVFWLRKMIQNMVFEVKFHAEYDHIFSEKFRKFTDRFKFKGPLNYTEKERRYRH